MSCMRAIETAGQVAWCLYCQCALVLLRSVHHWALRSIWWKLHVTTIAMLPPSSGADPSTTTLLPNLQAGSLTYIPVGVSSIVLDTCA
jgi:hypothetical protein